MSRFFNYDASGAAEIYEKARYPVGADIIAGLLHVHCGKQLKELHVLDAGCGTGHYTKALINLGVGKLTLLDVSSAMLNVTRKKLKPYIDNNTVEDVIQAKLPNIPFADGTFDAVMFLAVLHHFDKSDYVKTIQAAKQVLRPNGVVLMTTILPLISRDASWFGHIHPTITESVCSYLMTTKQHVALFAEQGFQCVAAMNLLNMATPSVYVNYFDHEGPLKEEWRIGINIFQKAGDEVMHEIESKFNDLKRKGLLKQFMNDNDHTDETGFVTLLAFKLSK